MNGVFRQMRIGDMALFAVDGQRARQTAAPPVFERVAQSGNGGGFADNAVIDMFATCFERIDHFGGAVVRVAFFIGGDEQGEAAVKLRMGGGEAFAGGHETSNSGFHVGCAARVQFAVVFGGGERVERPLPHIACGHDVGMAGKAEQGGCAAQPGIEIFGVAEVHFFDLETDGAQALG